MANVTCSDCGRRLDAREMTICDECYSYVCPSCSGASSFCSQCRESEQELF